MTSAPAPTQPKQRILLVDDDEDDYILTRGMLVDSNRDKFVLDWASNYVDGLDRLMTGSYAAALVDYDLGAQKGTELIETALAGGCQTPMIVFTGRGSYNVDVQAMQSGAADYINKAEASPALLERSIRYAIERKHAERALHNALAQAESGRRTLEAVMQNVPVGIVLTGGPPDFPIEKVSRHVVKLTGRSIRQLIGMPVGQHQDNWRLLLADGKTRPSEADLPLYRAAYGGETTQNEEMVLIGAHGRRMSILASAAPIRDHDGQIVAAIGVFHDITERKQAEQDLRHERELLQTLVDRIPVMLTVYDPTLQKFRFNRELERLLGWTAEDAQDIDVDLMEKFYPDPVYRQMVAEYMVSLEEGWRDFEVTAKDGSVVPSSWSNVRLSDDTQIGIGIDLRERLQAEQAVADSEAVLRGFFESESVLAGIVELDGDDLVYVMSNPKLADFFGQTPETMTGRRASELGVDPDSLAGWMQTYHRCLETRAPVEQVFPFSYHEKTGWYLGTFSQIPSGATGLPRFAVVIVDITERKQIEQALHLSEERFRLASLATTAVIYDWDLVTDEVYESEAILQVVGYRPGEAPHRGDQRWWPANIHPEDSDRIRRALQAAMNGSSDSIAYEYRIRHADGHWVEIWDQAYIVRDEHGDAIRIVGTCTDISERKRWEARTRQQNAVLDAINRIFQEALTASTEEELGVTCLSVAEELTQSPLGFIGEVGPADQMNKIAISGNGWVTCGQLNSLDKPDLPDIIEMHGLFGRVLKDGQSLLTNDPPEHPDHIGLPDDHVPLTAFLGAPLVQAGHTIGLIAVGNRPDGYSDADREALEAIAPAVVEAFARKRTEQALRESEERFRIALANSGIVIFSMDCDLRYTWVYNPHNHFANQPVIGKRDEDLLDPQSAAKLAAIKRQALATGQILREEVMYQIDGHPVTYDLTIEPLRDEVGQIIGLVVAAMDITRARQIEREMRSAADRLEIQRQILQHREQERMQIARDMHDGLLQELIGLLYMLREGLEITDRASRTAKFTEIMAVLQAQIQEVRAFCSNLRPPSLVPFGLERSINQFASALMEKTPELVIELDMMKDGRLLPEDLRMALFRIVQESVNNARKHAQAHNVRIRFTFDDQEIFLEVQDDGIGFEVPDNWLTLSRRGHLGLVGIHERAEAVGGRLQVTSCPGEGTRVQVTVPRNRLQPQAEGS